MHDWLAAQTMARPDGVALVIDDTTFTFRALNERVAGFAARLAAAGAQRGGVLGILLPNRLEAALAVYAAARLGVTLALLNTRLTPAELDGQIARAACSLLVCDSETLSVALELNGAPPMVCVDPVDRPPVIRLDQLPADTVENYRAGTITLDDPFAIMFTSGTSGTPRGALLTYGAIFAGAMGSAYRIGVLPHDRWLCVLPLYHVGGVSILLRSCLYGTAVDLWRRFEPDAILQRLYAAPVTLISLVPTMLYRLLERHDPATPPCALRLALLGGAATPPDLAERAAHLGWPVATTYGLTEAASQVATALPEDVRRKPGSVGKPLIFSQVRVVDESGRDQAPGMYGEIIVGGPTLMQGYLGDMPLERAPDGDAWFATGDIGYLDADGDLWVVQRRSDLIISGGENIYPSEIEQVVRAHPAVADAAVIGVPSPEWGQQVGAVLVLRDATVHIDDILAFCRTRLAGYKLPRIVRVVDELPRTASGKLQRAGLRELLGEGETGRQGERGGGGDRERGRYGDKNNNAPRTGSLQEGI